MESTTNNNTTITNNTTNNENYKLNVEEAYKLETQLENIENQYNKQLLNIIKDTQTFFYKKYGSKIQTLEDLLDYINSEQKKGPRQLKRKLQNIFMQTGGEFDSINEQDFKNTADELLNNYKRDYFPEDNFQIKRNKEAQILKQLVLQPVNTLYMDDSFDDGDRYSIKY